MKEIPIRHESPYPIDDQLTFNKLLQLAVVNSLRDLDTTVFQTTKSIRMYPDLFKQHLYDSLCEQYERALEQFEDAQMTGLEESVGGSIEGVSLNEELLIPRFMVRRLEGHVTTHVPPNGFAYIMENAELGIILGSQLFIDPITMSETALALASGQSPELANLIEFMDPEAQARAFYSPGDVDSTYEDVFTKAFFGSLKLARQHNQTPEGTLWGLHIAGGRELAPSKKEELLDRIDDMVRANPVFENFPNMTIHISLDMEYQAGYIINKKSVDMIGYVKRE